MHEIPRCDHCEEEFAPEELDRTTLLAIRIGELDEEETFHDALPWLRPYRRPGSLPWACEHLD